MSDHEQRIDLDEEASSGQQAPGVGVVQQKVGSAGGQPCHGQRQQQRAPEGAQPKRSGDEDDRQVDEAGGLFAAEEQDGKAAAKRQTYLQEGGEEVEQREVGLAPVARTRGRTGEQDIELEEDVLFLRLLVGLVLLVVKAKRVCNRERSVGVEACRWRRAPVVLPQRRVLDDAPVLLLRRARA
eukprot:CAMPEP_0114627808 /NCGR_PEP_ID=MMETSP0168-20121206/12490_1 /TAXON_ID=95228 ORGANISM="Vannella sp., Strain DIVA3 517/6/12" /NCGR_SAMPLE_ID=MMETSP0168 /ASSEMBLY_ACC=CAM_ASM_000044 /LENGTH=182 /DNA_ID=CAMNT_0001839159 /DNA_START=36 /DNA_END=580 /DNA_ORIENTATION=-